MILKTRNILLITVLSFSSLFLSPHVNAMELKHNIGVGVGVPFGIFGASYGFEMNLTDSFAIIPSVAAGTDILAGSTSEVGMRVLFGNKSNRVRYGLSYWNGNNTIIDNNDTTYTQVTGTTAGINLRIQLGANKNHIIDIHALRRVSPTTQEIEKKYNATSKNSSGTLLGLGYVVRF